MLLTNAWYEFELIVDFSVAGAKATLRYRNLTAGEITFTTDSILQAVPLHLTPNAKGHYSAYYVITRNDCELGSSYVDNLFVEDPCEGESDCNSNGTADDCDIAEGTSADCDTNGVPDECQGVLTGEDYDGDGLIDPCPGAPGDMDNDGVANAADVCDFTPAGASVQPDGSLRADIDGDCDVDLADHAIMAEEFTGPRT